MKTVDNNPEPNARKPNPCIRENALNRLCLSLGSLANSKRFKAFPEAYGHGFGLTRDETHAVTDLDIQRLLQLGAGIERLGLLTAIFELNVYELGGQQSGMRPQQFAEQTGGSYKTPH